MRTIASITSIALCLLVAGAIAPPAEAGWRYVDAVDGVDAGNECHDYTEPCATIQHAIDEAVAWDIVDVAAGEYTENPTVDKRLEFHGPNWHRGIENRDPEAILDGGTGTALTVEAANVKFGGFKIVSEGSGTGVHTSGAAIDDLEINDNLIEGGAAAVELGASGEGNEIRRNVIRGDTGIDISGSDHTEMAIEYNRFDDPLAMYGVFSDIDTSIEDLELTGNEFEIPSEIRGLVTGQNLLRENEFDLASPGAVALKVRTSKSRLMGNVFNGHGTSGCLQLLGSQPGLDPSEKALMSGNTFRDCSPYGIELGPEVDAVTVRSNVFPGSYEGVRIGNASAWDVSEHEILVTNNRFVGTTQRAIRNLANGTLDAANNWWGCNGGPGSPGCDSVSGGVDSWPNIVLTAETRRNYEKLEPSVTALNPGEEVVVVAHLEYNSAGAYVAWPPIDGVKASFSASGGTILPWGAGEWHNGQAAASFIAGSQPGPAGIAVSTDNQTIGVPMKILGDLPSLPPPPPHPTSTPPRITRIAAKLSPARKLVLGKVFCGTSPCSIRPLSASLKVGGARFPFTVRIPKQLAAGAEGSVRGFLTKPALRQLAKGKRGKVVIAVEATDASGASVTGTVRVDIDPRD